LKEERKLSAEALPTKKGGGGKHALPGQVRGKRERKFLDAVGGRGFGAPRGKKGEEKPPLSEFRRKKKNDLLLKTAARKKRGGGSLHGLMSRREKFCSQGEKEKRNRTEKRRENQRTTVGEKEILQHPLFIRGGNHRKRN